MYGHTLQQKPPRNTHCISIKQMSEATGTSHSSKLEEQAKAKVLAALRLLEARRSSHLLCCCSTADGAVCCKQGDMSYSYWASTDKPANNPEIAPKVCCGWCSPAAVAHQHPAPRECRPPYH
jgi:hypothetical protein